MHKSYKAEIDMAIYQGEGWKSMLSLILRGVVLVGGISLLHWMFTRKGNLKRP